MIQITESGPLLLAKKKEKRKKKKKEITDESVFTTI